MSPEAMIAVADTVGSAIHFLDAHSGRHLGQVRDLPAMPHELCADVSRRLLYAASTYRSGGYGSDRRSHEVAVIDVDRLELVDVIDTLPYLAPHDLHYDRETDRLFVSTERNSHGECGILVIDARTRTIAGIIPTRAPDTHWIAVDEIGARLFATHKTWDEISVVDLLTQELVGAVRVPGGAEEVEVSPDGRWVYANVPAVTEERIATSVEMPAWESGVVKIDATSLEVAGFAPLEGHNSALHLATNGMLFVMQLLRRGRDGRSGGAGPGTLSCLDPESLEVRARRELGPRPFTARSSNDGNTLYVAHFADGSVVAIDSTSRHLDTVWWTSSPGVVSGHGMAVFEA